MQMVDVELVPNSPRGLEPEQLTGHLGILLLTGF